MVREMACKWTWFSHTTSEETTGLNSWEEMNAWETNFLAGTLAQSLGGDVIFAGDFNHGPSFPDLGVDGEFQNNYALWHDTYGESMWFCAGRLVAFTIHASFFTVSHLYFLGFLVSSSSTARDRPLSKQLTIHTKKIRFLCDAAACFTGSFFTWCPEPGNSFQNDVLKKNTSMEVAVIRTSHIWSYISKTTGPISTIF